MTALTSLLEELREAELAYKTAKSSLDGSNALIIAKQRLKEARYSWLAECEHHVINYVLNVEEVEENA